MRFFKAIALAITLFFAFNASAEEPVTLQASDVCDIFAQDALDLGLLRAGGTGQEELEAWVKDRITDDVIFLTFLPGNLLIISMLADIEISDNSVMAFVQATHEVCMKTIVANPSQWIQAVPGQSKILREGSSRKIMM